MRMLIRHARLHQAKLVAAYAEPHRQLQIGVEFAVAFIRGLWAVGAVSHPVRVLTRKEGVVTHERHYIGYVAVQSDVEVGVICWRVTINNDDNMWWRCGWG